MKQGSELKLILREFVRAVKVCTDHASLLRDSADGIEQYLAEIDVPVRAVNPPRNMPAERITAKDMARNFTNLMPDGGNGVEYVLSRQYLAALEKIARLSAILESVLTESDERNSPIRGWSIDDLQRESDDAWPLPEKVEAEVRVEVSSFDAFDFSSGIQASLSEGAAVVLLIMPRNVGRDAKGAPRGHSAIWSKADIVAEWEDGRWHVVKDKGAGR